MKEILRIWVDGIPKSQPRVKACIRGKHAGVYTPGTASDWKTLLAIGIKDKRPSEVISCPVLMVCDFMMPRPQRLMTRKSPECEIQHTAKPDLDNLEKAVMDVMTATGLISDDSIICDKITKKRYVRKSDMPGMRLILFEVEE